MSLKCRLHVTEMWTNTADFNKVQEQNQHQQSTIMKAKTS
jgi:hypothetical protein